MPIIKKQLSLSRHHWDHDLTRIIGVHSIAWTPELRNLIWQEGKIGLLFGGSMLLIFSVMLFIFKIVVDPVRDRLQQQRQVYANALVEYEFAKDSEAYSSLAEIRNGDTGTTMRSPGSYRNFSYPPSSKLFRARQPRRSVTSKPDEDTIEFPDQSCPEAVEVSYRDQDVDDEFEQTTYNIGLCSTSVTVAPLDKIFQERRPGCARLSACSTATASAVSSPSIQKLVRFDSHHIASTSAGNSTNPFSSNNSELPSIRCQSKGIHLTLPKIFKNPSMNGSEGTSKSEGTGGSGLGTRYAICQAPIPPKHDVDAALVFEVLKEQITSLLERTGVYRLLSLCWQGSPAKSDPSTSRTYSSTQHKPMFRALMGLSRTKKRSDNPPSQNLGIISKLFERLKWRVRCLLRIETTDGHLVRVSKAVKSHRRKQPDIPGFNYDGATDIPEIRDARNQDDLTMSGALSNSEEDGSTERDEVSSSRTWPASAKSGQPTYDREADIERSSSNSPTGTVRRIPPKAASTEDQNTGSPENDYALYVATLLPDQTPRFATACYDNMMSPHSSLRATEEALGGLSGSMGGAVSLKREPKVRKGRFKLKEIQFDPPAREQ